MEYTVVDPSNGQAIVHYFDKAISPEHILDARASENLTRFTAPLAEEHKAFQKRLQEALAAKALEA